MAEQNPIEIPRRVIDLTGKAFGKLRVISYAGAGRSNVSLWHCRCECGEAKIITGHALRRSSKPSRSCGCMSRAAARIHGMWQSPEFRVWSTMKDRCYRKESKGYECYGGRGIAVCQRWLSSFEAFFADMGARPTPQHSLDRINVDGNYESSNCRWATSFEQARNRRTNHFIEFRGERLCITDWCFRTGLAYNTLYNRIANFGWSVERAITTPPRPKYRK